MQIFTRVRVLPVTIFVAALILTVKVGNVVDGFSELSNGLPASLPVANAQAQENQEPKNAPPPPPDIKEAIDGEKPAADPETPDGDKQEAKKTEPEPEPEPEDDNPENDPTLFTQSEIDLLQQLAERRELIEKRTQELTVRQGFFEAAEKRIDRKIAELRTLQGVIEKLLKKQNAEEDAKLQSLVKIYENMKPKDAAQIFEELDMDTLLLVAERMKERKLAPVMAIMNPIKAKEMTVELTKLRQLPLPGANTGG